MAARKCIFLCVITATLLTVSGGCNLEGSGSAGDSSEADTLDNALTGSASLDLDKIKERGVLKAITTYGSTSYFIYRGRPMGYEYELLNRLAKDLDVELEIIVAHDLGKMFDMLNNGEGDIIAYNLKVTKKNNERAEFTRYLQLTNQVLVQRKPDNWRNLKTHQAEKLMIRNPIQLAGENVYVRKNSAYEERLHNLSNEIGAEIRIKEVPGHLETEELIRMVSEGFIDYTIADRHMAEIVAAKFSNVDIKTEISFNQKNAWAVRKSSPQLLEAVNTWLDKETKGPDFYVIFNKYFKNRTAYTQRVKSKYFARDGGQISPYDHLFKQYSENINWDWLLLAALAYQESRFYPDTISWAGAVGLMQLMPQTAESFGAVNASDPQESVKAGIKFIGWLERVWAKHIPDENERIKFVLASYNVGPGHVLDARRLAAKYGRDPNKWSGHVDYYLLLKSEEKYYTDPVVKEGYCRGKEPYLFVKEVLQRYDQYKRVYQLIDIRRNNTKFSKLLAFQG